MTIENKTKETLIEELANWATAGCSSNGEAALLKLENNPRSTVSEMVDDFYICEDDQDNIVDAYMEVVEAAKEEIKSLMN